MQLTAHVTPANQATDPYFYIPFDVPPGTSRIDVVLAYPKAENCVIDLGALDPRIGAYPSSEGFRGWSGGARDRFFIASDDATPGYVHGQIHPGRWQVILGLYKVPPRGADVVLTITLDDTPRGLTPQPVRTSPVRNGAGWYRGDLHCHTFHSDAKGSPELLHAAARQAGLDFLAIADHNTTTARRYFHAQSSPDLVFVRGMEVTTAEGHANVYGVDEWIDFRMTRPGDAHTLARLVHEKGGLLSINHDKPPIAWEYDFPDADCQEVWQEPWMAWNWISLERYQQRLASGMRLSAIGGSDFHQPDRLMPEGPLTLARPTTVLWLEELSEAAVLAAMKAGRGYISENPTGPHLAISVEGHPMGATVPKRTVEARAEVNGAAGDILAWVDATGVVKQETIAEDFWTASYSGAPQKFLRAEIVAEASRERLMSELVAALDAKHVPRGLRDGSTVANQPLRRALSNPIYIDG